jgi:hypothetical protein
MITYYVFHNPFMQNISMDLWIYMRREWLNTKVMAVWVVVFWENFILFLFYFDSLPFFPDVSIYLIMYIYFEKIRRNFL